MKRLFLLSLAVIGAVVVSIWLLEVKSEVEGNWVIIPMLLLVISGAGIITLGIMLIKHIIGIFKK